jgi:hypothetical protein
MHLTPSCADRRSRECIGYIELPLRSQLRLSGGSCDDDAAIDEVDKACKGLELLGAAVAQAAAPLSLAGTLSPDAITAAIIQAVRQFLGTSTLVVPNDSLATADTMVTLRVMFPPSMPPNSMLVAQYFELCCVQLENTGLIPLSSSSAAPSPASSASAPVSLGFLLEHVLPQQVAVAICFKEPVAVLHQTLQRM